VTLVTWSSTSTSSYNCTTISATHSNRLLSKPP